MTAVGAVAILFSFIALSWMSARPDNKRLVIFFLMLLAHLAAAVVYYFYVQLYDADTSLYYADPTGLFFSGSGLGTWFTIALVQTMREWIGGTYLDYFLIFQTVGFWGLTLVARSIEEICLEVRVAQPQMLFVALFLPGLYFWTSAIGKDAPLFFSTALCTWAVLNIQRRYLWFVVGLAVMFPFRPHITMITLVAAGGAFAFDGRIRAWVRVLLAGVVVGGGAIVVGTLQSTLGVDVSSTDSVGGFITSQNEANEAWLEGSLAGAPYPVKLFSLLFRPFFLDAHGFLGLVASFENIFVFLMFITFVRQRALLLQLVRKVAFVRFSLIFCGIMIFFLSILYYNVGLGLRQKAMYMPSLISLYAAVVAAGIARRAQAGRQSHPGMIAAHSGGT